MGIFRNEHVCNGGNCQSSGSVIVKFSGAGDVCKRGEGSGLRHLFVLFIISSGHCDGGAVCDEAAVDVLGI